MKSQGGIVITLAATTAINAAFVVFGVEAHAAGKTSVLRQTLFNIDTRKTTKSALSEVFSYGAYANARFIGERNRRLDDGIIKEAQFSYQVLDRVAVSTGRMRFSDSNKWVIDVDIIGGILLGP